MAESNLFKVLSGLLQNDQSLKKIISANKYTNAQTIDARIDALSSAVGGNAINEVITSGDGGLSAKFEGHKLTLDLTPAGADQLGTITGNGSIVAVDGGKITSLNNKLSLFGQEYNGTASASIDVDSKFLKQSGGKVSLTVDGTIDGSDTVSGLVVGSTVKTYVEGVNDAMNTRVAEAERALAGYLDKSATVSGKLNAAKVELIGSETATEGIEVDLTSKNTIKQARIEAATVAKDLTDYVSSNDGALAAASGALSSAIGGTYSKDSTVAEDIQAAKNLANSVKIVKVSEKPDEKYASQYQLQINGQPVSDSIINIPKDQFLESTSYNAATQKLTLTFKLDAAGTGETDKRTVDIDVKDFFTTFRAGKGLNLNTTATNESANSFEILPLGDDVITDQNDTAKFLVIGDNGIGLSGISKAIKDADAAVTTAYKTADAELIGGTKDADIVTWKGDGEGSLQSLVNAQEAFALEIGAPTGIPETVQA